MEHFAVDERRRHRPRPLTPSHSPLAARPAATSHCQLMGEPPKLPVLLMKFQEENRLLQGRTHHIAGGLHAAVRRTAHTTRQTAISPTAHSRVGRRPTVLRSEPV